MRTTIVVSGSVTASQYEPVRREAVRLGLNPVIVRDTNFVKAEYGDLALRLFDIVDEDIAALGLAAAVGLAETCDPREFIVAKALESYGRVYAIVADGTPDGDDVSEFDIWTIRRHLWSLGQLTKFYFASNPRIEFQSW